jgi:hypothetical protein
MAYTHHSYLNKSTGEMWSLTSHLLRHSYRYHRLDGPAYILYNFAGQVERIEWRRYNSYYSPVLPDGSTSPALIRYHSNGQKALEMWYLHGQRHRLDGPAHIIYYSNGQKECEMWFKSGQLHRPNGPAYVEYDSDGRVINQGSYHLNGIFYSAKEAYEAKLLRLAQQS